MFKVGDKVLYKPHLEYGKGTIVWIPPCPNNYLYVKFPYINTDICVSKYDLLSTNDFQAVLLFLREQFNEIEKKRENDSMNTSDEFKLGDVVINILNPNGGTGIICEVISPKAYIVMFQNSFTSIHLECNADELQSFSIAAKNAFKNITSKINRMENNKMPDITNYTYNETTAVTTIEWSDGTKTTVRAEDPSTANGYTGFVAAYAKKAAGNNNTINKLYDEWAVKKPAREMKAEIKANAEALEEQRIAQKRKAKREQYLIRKRAAEIDREYQAQKLAHEKYGVPMDFKTGDNN